MYLRDVLERDVPNFQFNIISLFYPQYTFQQVMFKKSERVKKELFPHILKKGKVYYSKHFTLRVIQAKTKEMGKIAFVVSKKTERRAIKRNQIKRRCLHALKETLIGAPSFTGVFFVKKGVHTLSFSDVKGELKNILMSSQLIK